MVTGEERKGEGGCRTQGAMRRVVCIPICFFSIFFNRKDQSERDSLRDIVTTLARAEVPASVDSPASASFATISRRRPAWGPTSTRARCRPPSRSKRTTVSRRQCRVGTLGAMCTRSLNCLTLLGMLDVVFVASVPTMEACFRGLWRSRQR